MLSKKPRGLNAFTLVELLVVIGLIALLVGILLPALNRARRASIKVQCQSNLRQIGQGLSTYAVQWKGWIIPPYLGTEVPVDQRWGVWVFKPAVAHPPVIRCPADVEDPDGNHSYILNGHLIEKGVKYSTKLPRGMAASDLPIAGEKVPYRDDYYLSALDNYYELIDFERHAKKKGTNTLFLDMHVSDQELDVRSPTQADPWDIP